MGGIETGVFVATAVAMAQSIERLAVDVLGGNREDNWGNDVIANLGMLAVVFGIGVEIVGVALQNEALMTLGLVALVNGGIDLQRTPVTSWANARPYFVTDTVFRVIRLVAPEWDEGQLDNGEDNS